MLVNLQRKMNLETVKIPVEATKMIDRRDDINNERKFESFELNNLKKNHKIGNC